MTVIRALLVRQKSARARCLNSFLLSIGRRVTHPEMHLHSQYDILTGEPRAAPVPKSTGLRTFRHKNPANPHGEPSPKVNHKTTSVDTWRAELHNAGTRDHRSHGRKFGITSPNRQKPAAAFVPAIGIVDGKPTEHRLTPEVKQPGGTTHHRPSAVRTARRVPDPEVHGYAQSGRAATHHHVHGAQSTTAERKSHGIGATDITEQYTMRHRASPPRERPVRVHPHFLISVLPGTTMRLVLRAPPAVYSVC